MVLLPYEFTLFSNKEFDSIFTYAFYYLMNLHYSQTTVYLIKQDFSFTTL